MAHRSFRTRSIRSILDSASVSWQFRTTLGATVLTPMTVGDLKMPTVGRRCDELAFPECGAENVVIVGKLQQIPGRCKACGKDVVFVSEGWTMRFLDKIKEHRPYDPMLPGGR